ncbi:MAG: cyclodeaminase/cyclohydrolase family protein [Candidatus Izemoplasmatales bacterium]|jgi:formiminotetrahydrofolate cyclodeaminase|nr:cyclodeaminase/cyclohydrolase family protein [Candidatus Izemoplasmatales bacterium]
MLIDLKLKDFLDELASSSPAPGGGSVSALAGAAGCSLILMVGNLTIGKKKFKLLSLEKQDEYQKSIKKFNYNKEKFVELIDKDTEAFNLLMKAYKMSKNTSEELVKRQFEIEKATLGCIKVPLEVSLLGLETIKELGKLIENSNKNTISDQGVSVLMLHSAIEGACMNVLINLPGLEDEKQVNDYKKIIEDILSESTKIKDQLLKEIRYLLK